MRAAAVRCVVRGAARALSALAPPAPPATAPRGARALSLAPTAPAAAGLAAEGGAAGGEGGDKTSVTCALIDGQARAIFDAAWAALAAKHGADKLMFPRELIFLTGAPGAGKGTQLATIKRERDLQHAIEVSSLFTTPAFEAMKNTGRMISDEAVVATLLEELLDAKYAKGAIVDGFPRTAAQASAIVLLHEALSARCARFAHDPEPAVRARTRRPRFTLGVLWCDEAESVARQMRRGAGLQRAASIAKEVGLAAGAGARSTDLDEERARLRFRVFKAEVAACMAVTRDALRTVFIDASGAPEAVAERTRDAFRYSAALDLDPAVYELLRPITSASALVRSARSELVARLSAYATDAPADLARVTELLQKEVMHILERQALSGAALIRSTNPLLDSPAALNMTLDVLTERGFVRRARSAPSAGGVSR